MVGRCRLPDALRRADTLARAGPPAVSMSDRQPDQPPQTRGTRHERAFSVRRGLHKYAGHARYRAMDAHDGRNADDVMGASIPAARYGRRLQPDQKIGSPDLEGRSTCQEVATGIADLLSQVRRRQLGSVSAAERSPSKWVEFTYEGLGPGYVAAGWTAVTRRGRSFLPPGGERAWAAPGLYGCWDDYRVKEVPAALGQAGDTLGLGRVLLLPCSRGGDRWRTCS